MKYKSTNRFMIAAAVLAVLALAMNLLIYFGPQNAFISAVGGTETETRVTHVGASICSALTAAVYLFACTVTVKSDRAKDGWPVCLTALILHIVIMAVQQFYLNIYWAHQAIFQGADYFAAYGALNASRQYLETPLLMLALVFLAISFGTLCGRDEEIS